MACRLALARAAILEQRLAQRAFPVRVRGLAAGGELDGQARLPLLAADHVDVGEAERGGGELDERPDPDAAQPREQVARGRVLHHPVDLHDDALVERAEAQRVPVALRQFQYAVGDGMFEIEARAKPIGDGRHERRLALGEVVAVGGDPLLRHPDRRLRRPAPRLHPAHRRVGRPAAARGQHDRARVAGVVPAAHQPGVRAVEPRGARAMGAHVLLLAQLAERADRGLVLVEAVAVGIGAAVVGEDEVRLHGDHACPVEPVEAEAAHLAQRCQAVAEQPRHLRERRHRAADRGARSAASGMCRTPGGPAIWSSSSASAAVRSTSGACSKGVQIVSKSSGASTSR